MSIITLILILSGIAVVVIVLSARKRDVHQKETDLRLTYKRYKELYPHSEITYPEYKRLQMKNAYKRAVSSDKIKRMVR